MHRARSYSGASATIVCPHRAASAPLSEQQVAQLEAFVDGLDGEVGARLTCAATSASDSQYIPPAEASLMVACA